MGIKGFCAWLRIQYPSCFVALPPRKRLFFDSVYIDVNQFVHRAARFTHNGSDRSERGGGGDHRDTNGYSQMLKQIVYGLEHALRSKATSGKMIYLALDGAAPVAKLSIQQERRAESAVEALRRGLFDAQQITPGCLFMGAVEIGLKGYFEKYLKQKAEKYPKLCNMLVAIDGPTRPGEGEHKIAQQIRAEQHGRAATRCVFASDADVYLYSLLWNKPSGYIIDPFAADPALFSVDAFKAQVRNAHDFVLMCLMSGSDYGPAIKVANYRFLIPHYDRHPLQLVDVEKQSLNVANIRQFAKSFISSYDSQLVTETYGQEHRDRVSRDPWKLRQDTLANLRHLRWALDLLFSGKDADIDHFASSVGSASISIVDLAEMPLEDVAAFQTALDEDTKPQPTKTVNQFSAAVSAVSLLKETEPLLAKTYLPTPLHAVHADYISSNGMSFAALRDRISNVADWSDDDRWCVMHRPVTCISLNSRTPLISDHKSNACNWKADSHSHPQTLQDGVQMQLMHT